MAQPGRSMTPTILMMLGIQMAYTEELLAIQHRDYRGVSAALCRDFSRHRLTNITSCHQGGDMEAALGECEDVEVPRASSVTLIMAGCAGSMIDLSIARMLRAARAAILF